MGTVTIHAVHYDQPWSFVFFAIIPNPLGYDFDAGHAVDNNDGRIHHREHHLGRGVQTVGVPLGIGVDAGREGVEIGAEVRALLRVPDRVRRILSAIHHA